MNRTRLPIAALAALGLLSACSAPAPAAPAPGSTAPASSAPATSAPAASQPATTDVDAFITRMGTAQAGVKTYSMTMDMQTVAQGTEVAMTVEGEVDQSDPANVKMAIDMDMGGMAMKMLQVDGQLYVQMGMTGDSWMRVPEDQLDQYRQSADASDPLAGLRSVKDSVTGIEELGSEAVDGVPATHYRLTLDGGALDKLAGGGVGGEAEEFTYDLWVDAAGLLRRYGMELDLESEGESLPMKLSGTVGNYDEPVDITAPPKSKIVDMPS